MNVSALLCCLVVLLGVTLADVSITSEEAQAKYNWASHYLNGRSIHTAVQAAARGAAYTTRFTDLHAMAIQNVDFESEVEVAGRSASSACPSNNALRSYQDQQRKIQILHETRARAFWELQADYVSCRQIWSQILQGNYAVIPYVAPNIGGVAHPADWMYATNMTMANGMVREMGIVNTMGYTHGTYCSVNPEKQVSPGFIANVFINAMNCEGAFCHFDVTSVTSTFEIALPDGTVIPPYVANLTTIGWVSFDSQHRINGIEVHVKGISRLNYIEPDVPNAFSLTRDQAASAMCFLVTGLLCITPETAQFQPTPFDPPGVPPGFVDCYTSAYSVPLGGLPSGYWKTMQCRYIHTLLAGDAPEMHCKHAGKSGGGQCMNKYLPECGLDANGNTAPPHVDLLGIPCGLNYIEAHSQYYLNRAFDPRDPDFEDCLDRRANAI